MTTYDIVIEGKFIDPVKGLIPKQVGIENGRIEKIGEIGSRLRVRERRVFSGYIFPGFIDMHVHLREDSSHEWDYKEDFYTGTRAAAHGGVTTVADMPNTPRPAISREELLKKKELARKGIVDIFLYGGVNRDNIEELESMSDLIVGYKIYTCETTGGLWLGYADIDRALARIKNTGKPVIFHCEEPSMFHSAGSGSYADSRPIGAEITAIKYIIDTARRYKVPAHITHITSKNSIDILKNETCDVTPHHLYYNKYSENQLLRMNPPLRSEIDRVSLMDALNSGKVTAIATDHAPHTIEDKQKGACGVPGLDTYGAFVSWLIEERGVDRTLIAQMTSYNPAQILGFEDRGRIEEGYYADFTVIDKKIANPHNNYSKCGWSSLHGPDRVAATIYRGRIIAERGVIP